MMPFTTIDSQVLDAVTGGRTTHVPQLDPALVQGVGELAQSLQVVGQGLVASQQQKDGQMLQVMQQMMQSKLGR